MKKLYLMSIALVCAALTLASVMAASTTDLSNQNWKVYNVKPAAASFWDINKAQFQNTGGVMFPFQQFLSTSTGSFAVYLLNNYNVDMTDKTITASGLSWTQGTYKTRSTVFPGAYVRIEFQDVVAGNYNSNDYWWYTDSLDLNALSAGSLTAPLADRAGWTNVCGQLATDTTPHPGPNCVGSTDPAVSPYDGFTNAVKNVKQVGLSFGSVGSYASGVALDDGTGTFYMDSFTVQ